MTVASLSLWLPVLVARTLSVQYTFPNVMYLLLDYVLLIKLSYYRVKCIVSEELLETIAVNIDCAD